MDMFLGSNVEMGWRSIQLQLWSENGVEEKYFLQSRAPGHTGMLGEEQEGE